MSNLISKTTIVATFVVVLMGASVIVAADGGDDEQQSAYVLHDVQPGDSSADSLFAAVDEAVASSVLLPAAASVPSDWRAIESTVVEARATGTPHRVDLRFTAPGNQLAIVTIIPDPGRYSPGNAQYYSTTDAGTVYVETRGDAANVILQQATGRVVALQLGPTENAKEIDLEETIALVERLAK